MRESDAGGDGETETRLFDIDGIAVAILPDATPVAFEPGGHDESRPYPDRSGASGSDMGDLLSRDEFAAWLTNGFNRFRMDVLPFQFGERIVYRRACNHRYHAESTWGALKFSVARVDASVLALAHNSADEPEPN